METRRPNAFVALPYESGGIGELKAAVRQALADHDVVEMAPSESTDWSYESLKDAVQRSDFVIADLTGANPNVMFEIGLALGLNKPLLLLSQQSGTTLPSDVQARQVAIYKPDNVPEVRKYVDYWLRDTLAKRSEPATY